MKGQRAVDHDDSVPNSWYSWGGSSLGCSPVRRSVRETEFEDSVDADQMVSTGGAAVDLYENRIRMVLLG
jgi:hypothetical protein